MEVTRKERMSNFELMRIISMFMIVVWHVITRNELVRNTSGTVSLVLSFLQFFLAVHVNSFMLLSGYFQVDKKIKIRKVIDLLFTSWFYRCLAVIIFVSLGLVTFSYVDIIKEISFLDITDNYWFINLYIALYLLAPFLNTMIKNFDQKEHRRCLITMTILFSIIPIITNGKNIDNTGFSIIHFIYLYLIGAYLRKYPLKDNWHFKRYSKEKFKTIILCLGITSFVLNFMLSSFSKYLLTFDNELINYIGTTLSYAEALYSNPLVLIQSIAYFVFFENTVIKSKVINKISTYMLGVYMIHENKLVRTHIYEFLNISENVNPLVAVLIVLGYALVIFILCIIIEALRTLIVKFFKKRRFFVKCENKICHFVANF